MTEASANAAGDAAGASAAELRPGEVHVWYVDLDGDPPAGADAAACLDTGEHDRAARFLREVDRHRFRASHCAFRHLVSRYLACQPAAVQISRHCAHCGHPNHGKPTVTDPAGTRHVEVSLSHAGSLAALAVAQPPIQVGIDVELRRPGLDWTGILAAAGASEPPGEPPEDAPPGDGFGRWTQLEAVAKAAGTGIVTMPRLAPPDTDGWALAELPTDQHRRTWQVRSLDGRAGYAAALAVSEIPPAGIRIRWHR